MGPAERRTKMKSKAVVTLMAVIAILALIVSVGSVGANPLPPISRGEGGSWIEISPLSYDPTTEVGSIHFNFKISPSALYRSTLEVGATRFDRFDLPPRLYEETISEMVSYGLSDPLMGHTSIVGNPRVPIVKLYVAIPPGMDDSIEIKIDKTQRVGMIPDALIVPVESHEAPMSPPKYEMNKEAYSSDEPYPVGWITEPHLDFFSTFELVTFEAYPIQYIPAKREVYVYDISGTIFLKGPLPTGEPPKSVFLESTARELIPNYKEARQWPAYIRPFDPAIAARIDAALGIAASTSYPYLIITADDFLPQANKLAMHKTTTGTPTLVVTVQNLVDGVIPVGFILTQQTGDIPQTVRAFISFMHLTHATQYVALFGDVSMIGISTFPDTNLYGALTPHPLGTQSYHEESAYAQSFNPSSYPHRVQGIVSAGLYITKVHEPTYNVVVEIREGLPYPEGTVKANFTIRPSDVNTQLPWVHKHFDYFNLDPNKMYYLDVHTTGTDTTETNYYELWTVEDYEPTGTYLWYNGTTWTGALNMDMVFRSQLYTSVSVPARYAKNPYPYYPPDEVCIPSDYYYACLDGDWDNNGDGWYADIADWPFDLTPKVSVGRFPVDSAAKANTMVDRIIDYESTIGRICAGSLETRVFSSSFDNDVIGLFKNYHPPVTECANNRDCFKNGFNQGVEVVHMNGGHGCWAYVIGYVPNNGTPWFDRISNVFVSTILNQTPHFPVVFVFSCSTGEFDLNPYETPAAAFGIPWYKDDSLAEAFVVHGRAAAYIGCTRDAPSTGGEDFDGDFWKAYLTGMPTGDALAAAKTLIVPISWSSLNIHTILAYQLFGDPQFHYSCYYPPPTPTPGVSNWIYLPLMMKNYR
jgi:hypothetical protein